MSPSKIKTKPMIRFYLFIAILIFANSIGNAQGVLPINRYYLNQDFTINHPVPFSFGYSLRLIDSDYEGPSIRARRATDNAEGDVYFNRIGLVGNQSIVTITSVGSSSYTIGQRVTLRDFIDASVIHVTIWYNQTTVVGFDAVQESVGNQPVLELNTAGRNNNMPAIRFRGNDYLRIIKPVEEVLNDGINGSFMLTLKTTRNKAHFTFGTFYRTWRWAFHINWTNGFVFFDAAERCCARYRSYDNRNSLNVWKQYTFVRGTNYKTARVNTSSTALNNSPLPSTPQTGGEFHIGGAWGSRARFEGFMSEVIMYPTDLSVADLEIIERNQIRFWRL